MVEVDNWSSINIYSCYFRCDNCNISDVNSRLSGKLLWDRNTCLTRGLQEQCKCYTPIKTLLTIIHGIPSKTPKERCRDCILPCFCYEGIVQDASKIRKERVDKLDYYVSKQNRSPEWAWTVISREHPCDCFRSSKQLFDELKEKFEDI